MDLKTMEGKEMKMNDELRKWKLQLFADEPDPEEGGKPDNDNPDGGDPKKNKPDDDKGGEKKYTDDDVNGIVEKKFAKWKAQHEKDLAEAKKEAEKLAKMNADQKKDYDMEKLKAENEKLKAEAARIELGKEATNILKEHEVDATQDILDFVVGKDADSTKSNIDKFVEIINVQVKAAEVKRAKGKTPKDFGDGGDGNISEIAKRIEKYR